MYRFFDPPIHSITFSVDDLGLVPIYDMVKSDGVICDCYLLCSVASDLPVLLVYRLYHHVVKLLAGVPSTEYVNRKH